MPRPEKVEKKRQVQVYFTDEELKKIKKKANKAVLDVSPFLRKTVLESLGLVPEQ